MPMTQSDFFFHFHFDGKFTIHSSINSSIRKYEFDILKVLEVIVVDTLKRFSNTPNTKLILTGAALLVAIVGCSVAVARAITNDESSKAVDEGPLTSAKIVKKIREEMKNTHYVNVPIQAYIIPSVDAHQSEFPTARDNRVQYVSCFTGSSATIVINETVAVIWTDSRYHSQAEGQIDNKTWTLMKSGMPDVPTMQQWLLDSLPETSIVGIDPYLIQAKQFHELDDFLRSNGHKLVSIQQNLVDVVWENRPNPKLKELEPIEYTFSGKKVAEKLADVRKALRDLKAESMIVTSLEDVARLLNLRGSDFEYTPLFFAYVIISEYGDYLYLMDHERGTTNRIFNHFQTEYVNITIKEYNDTLAGISIVIRNTKGKMLLTAASEAIVSVVPGDRRLEAENPILGMRIIKNDVEAKGIREAYKRDGAAIIRYLYWLETELDVENITEMKGAEKLNNLRKTHENYRRLSFPTVSAVGPHAAMAYYTPTSQSDKQINRQGIYLLNAGTQYKDGTTDITRTVHFGNPSEQEKDAFTRVLKGFIAVATAIFPPGASFSFFDAMARRALWDVGLDYCHATGHGIGAYLNVHEVPPKLTSHDSPPGMIKNMFTTNEPGYYEDGQFGIRIENVLQVVDATDSTKHFGGKGAYKFDDITMIPIQAKLIDVNLLSEAEIKWLNDYHALVRSNIGPLLGDDSNILDWLENQTKPISKEKDDCNQNSTEKPPKYD